MKCQTCFASLPNATKFCPECGSKVSSSVLTVDEVPSAAQGAEAAQIYDRLLAKIRRLHEGESRVREFKSLCKSYGERKIDAKQFNEHLNLIVGSSLAPSLMPDLIRLVADNYQREQLARYQKNGSTDGQPSQQRTFVSNTDGSSSSSNSIGPPPPPAPARESETGTEQRSSSVFKGPHNWGSENKNKQKLCSICQKEFHWLRRRHQW